MIFLRIGHGARATKTFFRPLGFDEFFPRVYSMIWCEKNVDFSQFTPLRLGFFSSKIFIVRLSSMDAMLECEFYTKGNISLCRRSPYDTLPPPPRELYLFSADAIAGRRAHSDLLLRISYGKQPVSEIKNESF